MMTEKVLFNESDETYGYQMMNIHRVSPVEMFCSFNISSVMALNYRQK